MNEIFLEKIIFQLTEKHFLQFETILKILLKHHNIKSLRKHSITQKKHAKIKTKNYLNNYKHHSTDDFHPHKDAINLSTILQKLAFLGMTCF